MSEYRLTIVKFENNENFEAELAKFREKNNNNYGYSRNSMEVSEPRPVKETRSLDVVLTAEEFEAIKGSVLKEFK